jgi:hypothetical protein
MGVPKLQGYDRLESVADVGMFLEQRIDYDGDNPIYIGYNKTPNCGTAVPTWFIVKLTYSGDNVTRVQMPSSGVAFDYAWDDRTTLFS